MLPLCGAAALVQVLRRPTALARLLYWLLLVALLAWPLHAVVVDWAATDNLVELMRGGGSITASALLASGVLAMGTCAGALACAGIDRHRRGALLVLAAFAAAAAPGALLAGLEPVVIKYDRVFSALQFILSASRDNYATGSHLILRYVAAFSGTTLVVAVLQVPWWRQTRWAPNGLAGRRFGLAPGNGQP